MQRPIILGSYHSAMGGRIYLNLSENIEHRSMSSTLVHEASHALLSSTTLLGFLQNIMQMEALCAAEFDKEYSADREECVRILHERTQAIQEIYANNMELLALEEQLGYEEMLFTLKNRPEEYQRFYMEMMPIHHSNLSCREKAKLVHLICASAMNAPLPGQALTDIKALADCLHGEFDPHRRLKQAICDYKEHGILPEQEPDLQSILHAAEPAILYTKPFLQEAAKKTDRILSESAEHSAADTINERMMKKVSLFEPSMIHPTRIQKPNDTDFDVFLVLKRVQNLVSQEHFYLISYDKTYISEEADLSELYRRIEKCVSVCVLFSEYDAQKRATLEFQAHKALLTVIIQTSDECAHWLQEEQKKGTIYVGELRTDCAQTEVSILFFCRRGHPQRLFVFPTLREIRHRLLKDFHLESYCYQANEEIFLKLFAALDNEVEMLRYLQGLLSLLLNRSWDALQKSDSFIQLISMVGGNLGNNILRIKPKNYFKMMAALPQMGTTEAPLFVLMRFEGMTNTGDTYANEKSNAPLLFHTKEAADQFAARYAPDYTGIGLDWIYWPFFLDTIHALGGRVILVLDVEHSIGKLVSVDDVAEIWYKLAPENL